MGKSHCSGKGGCPFFAAVSLLTKLAISTGGAYIALQLHHRQLQRKQLQQSDKPESKDSSSSCQAEIEHHLQQIPTPLLDSKYSAELKLAIKLAIEAGYNMKTHLNAKGTEKSLQSLESLNVDIKRNINDFATAIDVQNEELITKAIRTHFPKHEVIGEEDTGTGSVPLLSQKTNPTWIIDPVDGTTNFFSGLPLTCVSIGLCDFYSEKDKEMRPVMGVVYAPATQELYLGIHQCGAYRNGVRIYSNPASATKAAQEKKSLAEAVVIFEWGSIRDHTSINTVVNATKQLMLQGCRCVRMSGCGVLDLCHVASGRVDVVYAGLAGEGWKPWDYCAGSIIALEAGCTIQSIFGRPSLVQSKTPSDEFDAQGKVVANRPFDIYSSSVICGVDERVVEECRAVLVKYMEEQKK